MAGLPHCPLLLRQEHQVSFSRLLEYKLRAVHTTTIVLPLHVNYMQFALLKKLNTGNRTQAAIGLHLHTGHKLRLMRMRLSYLPSISTNIH
jgi:hypothetical protein